MRCHQYCGGAADFAHRQSSGYRGCVREMVVLIGLCVWSWPTLAKTDFGQNRLWPKPTLAKCVWCCVVLCVWCVCGVCVLCGVGTCFTVSWNRVSRVGVGFKVLVWSCSVPPGPPFPGPPFPWTAGPPFPWTTQNFAFFSTLPPQNSLFSSLSGVSSWNFGGVFEGPGPLMCTFGVLGLWCETPEALGSPGFHTAARVPKRAHLRVPVIQTPKFNEETPREGRKERK